MNEAINALVYRRKRLEGDVDIQENLLKQAEEDVRRHSAAVQSMRIGLGEIDCAIAALQAIPAAPPPQAPPYRGGIIRNGGDD